MKTSQEVRERFPVGTRVETHDRGYLLVGKESRAGSIVGYCVGPGSERKVRVSWDEWRASSSVVIDADGLVKLG